MNNKESLTKDLWKKINRRLGETFYGFFFIHSIIMFLTWIVPPQTEIYEHLVGMFYFNPPYRLPLILFYLVGAVLLQLYLNEERRELEATPRTQNNDKNEN